MNRAALIGVVLLLAAPAVAQDEEEAFIPWTGTTQNGPATPGSAPAPAPAEKPPASAAPATKAPTQGDAQAPASTMDEVDDWAAPPGAPIVGDESSAGPTPPPATAPPVLSAPPSSPTGPSSSAPVPPQAEATVRPPPREMNRVSMYGAPTLGQWNRGVGAYLGFPLLGVKAGIGLLDRLDAGVGFDSFYGVMNEVRGFAKYQLVDETNWTVAIQLEGGAAFFAQRPEAEGKGARWLTGRRNYNIEPGVIVSFRGTSPQAARLFLDLRYHLALDTQPFTRDPLGGVPPPVLPGHNVPVRMGAEMPFSSSTSFLFMFGFDVHGRREDAVFMPVVSVGLVTGF